MSVHAGSGSQRVPLSQRATRSASSRARRHPKSLRIKDPVQMERPRRGDRHSHRLPLPPLRVPHSARLPPAFLSAAADQAREQDHQQTERRGAEPEAQQVADPAASVHGQLDGVGGVRDAAEQIQRHRRAVAGRQRNGDCTSTSMI